jgi:HlyD family secretion protein
MNLKLLNQSIGRQVRQRPIVFGLVLIGIIALIVFKFASSGPKSTATTYYEVKQGDFLVSVVEGGTLQAVNEMVIRNEVEGTSRIINIVPEGSYVKKGQLLVELDSSASQDAVSQQQISVEKAQFALIQAQQQLEIQKSVVDSEIQTAELKVEFAKSDVDKYVKGEAEQTRRNAQIEITNVLETLQIAIERLQWSEQLHKQGFETKGNLDNDRLKVNQTKLKLEQSETNLWMIETFDVPKKKRELEATLQEAKENLDRVKLQGDRKLAQFKADVESQQKTLELNQTKLARDKKQLAGTKIIAPQDGLVVYGSAEGGGHFSSESMIEEGAVVRNRQELIKLPDVSEMKLKVKIHESHINQVRPDQTAFVVLDSMPDQRFQGIVKKVALLPDTQARWGNPDLKVYATEIVITDKLPDVKPGVSAKAEIVITNLSNVLSIPIQTVTSRKGKPTVFLAGTTPKPVPITVGMYNTKFIEVTSGIKAGDRVMLSPPYDTKEKDLAGSILAVGEPVPESNGTNRPARARLENGQKSKGAPPDARSDDRENDNGLDNRAFRQNREEGVSPSEAPETGSEPGTARPRNAGGRRPPSAEMVKQFDLNGDGQLDDAERAAMREKLGRGRSTGASTNNPSVQAPARSDDNR